MPYGVPVSEASMSYDYSTGRVRIVPLDRVADLGHNYTLTNTDIGAVFRNDDTINYTITVPNTLIGGFSAGFLQYSTGTITLVAGANATNRSGKTALSAQYARGSVFVAKQNGGDTAAEFLVGGDFA
jgi:hypothetical protein